MKTILAALTLSALPAFATSITGLGSGADYAVRYDSWCSDHQQILTQNSKGETVIYRDCKVQGLVCRSATTRLIDLTVHAATCGLPPRD